MKKIIPLVLLAILTGCAQLPNSTVTYYLPKSSTTVTVAQTITCDAVKTPHVSLALNPKTVYMADYDVKNYGTDGLPTVHIQDLDSSMSDTDVDFTFTTDGRLKGINTGQTGQAQTVIKDVVSVGVSVAGLAGLTVDAKKSWCEQDDAAKNPVTITYTTATLLYKDLVFAEDTDIPLSVDSGSSTMFRALTKTSTFPEAKLMPKLKAHAVQDIQTVSEDKTDSGIAVVLPRMRKVPLELFWGVDKNNNDASVDAQSVYLPGEGSDRSFILHIPPPKPFGSQKFTLALDDSGAITDIHYVKMTGGGSALEAGQAVLTPLQPKSAEDRANSIKAQTDIIYEQQRQAACKASPSVSNCK
ncbi:hypothetical protein [Burkholderia ubonensis]|uniref:hypothetical protein n=1 Tax=Burkholderia ubonensis TaxID=101571 RepID=UPI00075C2C6D|nr:hypothetical protein [Burkholderia ubonensis]KVP17202.1 hypothetical protein WJ84_02670 [Burkholderia ubonensis]